MTETIIVALISALTSITGSTLAVISTLKAKKSKEMEDMDKRKEEQKKANDELRKDVKDNMRMIEKSISNLETKYEKETAIISLKISELQKGQEQTKDHETRIAVLEDKLKSAHHRIDGLEERIK